MATRGQSKYMTHLRNRLMPKKSASMHSSDSNGPQAQHDAMCAKAKTNVAKGKRGGDCNRTACQRPGAAWWYNKTMQAYYCEGCAAAINESCMHKDHIVSFGSMIYVNPPTSRIEEQTGGSHRFIVATADGTETHEDHVDYNAAFNAQWEWCVLTGVRTDNTPPYHYGELRGKMLGVRKQIEKLYPDQELVEFV